jgi:hypothetical protein
MKIDLQRCLTNVPADSTFRMRLLRDGGSALAVELGRYAYSEHQDGTKSD